MKLKLWARLEASREDRTLTGLLLPFDQPGATSLGRLTASATTRLDVAPDVVLNVQHDRSRPVGRAVGITSTPEGLRAVFKVATTRAGDDALAEAAEGLRAGLSIELDPIVTRGGAIVSGTISGAALVAEPAYPSARLDAAALDPVPDMGPDMGGDTPPDVPVSAVLLDGDPIVATVTITTDKKPEKASMTAAAKITTPALTAAAARTAEPMTTGRLFAALAAYGTTRMEAALSDIVPANTPGVGILQPQYVGELWDGVDYTRVFLDAFRHQDLTSYNVKGWKWNNRPVVGRYTGNNTDVPSGSISTTEVNGVLQRLAGAHDVDRIYTDFGDAEFWAAYYAAMAESYALQSDLYVRDVAREVPTTANGTRVHLLTGTAPAGVPTALWQIVEGCAKILNDLNTLPTHAWVTVDYWKPILYTPVTQVLTYLNAALGLKDGTLEGQGGGFKIIPVPVGSLTATNGSTFTGKTMVAHTNALSVRELGGGAPIRVNAIDVAKGGTDEGLFGYVGTLVEEPKGIVLYDAPAAT